MTAIAMEVCPMCDTCPRLAGRGRRVQVKCRCGACGPPMGSLSEAIVRWNRVVKFVHEVAREANELVRDRELDDTARTPARRPRGLRRMVRRLAWQCGLRPELGF
jgi:hypothetical protein